MTRSTVAPATTTSSETFGNDALFGGNNNPGSIADGDDTLHGGVGDDTLQGGRFNDKLFGEEGDDTLNGQYDCDLLDGGAGADSMEGGDGFVSCDAVSYASRTDAITVTLDNVANDGADSNGDGTPDEGDNVHVQRVLGGSGNDSFEGDNAFNTFCGGGGNDTLDGAGDGDAPDRWSRR